MSCWRRLRDWQEAGIWQAFHHALLDRLGRVGLIDGSRCSVDAASGGTATGRNPTDRGKPGSKRHLVVDRQGIPLAVLLTAPPTSTTAPSWRRRSTPCRRSASRVVGRDAVPRSCTPIWCTTSSAVAAPVGSAVSFRGPRDAASRAARSSADTARHGLLAMMAPSIGIGGGLAAPPLPHHRAYGSVHGGSSDQAAFGTNGGRPSAASVLLDRAIFRAGLAAIRQGPCALDAVCAASRRGTPLLNS
jgi:transposase